MNVKPLSLLWLRRDLRLHDHAVLAHALAQDGAVQPVFVFDTNILASFPNPHDRRLSFIAHTLCAIDTALRSRGGGLLVLHGKAEEILPRLARTLGADHIFAAEDFEPATMRRDACVQEATEGRLTLVKDHLIFSPTEILREGKSPYKVFTPYSRAWLAALSPTSSAPHPIHEQGRYANADTLRQQAQEAGFRVLAPEQGAEALLAAIGYKEVALNEWPVDDARARLSRFVKEHVHAYPTQRDVPSVQGTSRLSPYLRFGLVSVRECLAAAQSAGNSEKWIAELIWREFYAAILYHFPHTPTQEFNPSFNGTISWSQDEKKLEQWKQGRTGYPIVDAAMRELLSIGWMHNRTRMITASFLTKDLHIDWRLGEAHFAQHLMDYELASNVGGWQWAASTGTDAQPWFRIFNPVLQSQRFDPRGEYIRAYVPEIAHLSDKDIHEPWKKARPAGYPAPIVEHDLARKQILEIFTAAARQP